MKKLFTFSTRKSIHFGSFQQIQPLKNYIEKLFFNFTPPILLSVYYILEDYIVKNYNVNHSKRLYLRLGKSNLGYLPVILLELSPVTSFPKFYY